MYVPVHIAVVVSTNIVEEDEDGNCITYGRKYKNIHVKTKTISLSLFFASSLFPFSRKQK